MTIDEEREVAKVFAERTAEALQQVIEIMNEAKEHGLTINFAIGSKPNGKRLITDLSIVRVYE